MNIAEWSMAVLVTVFVTAAAAVWLAGTRLARYANAIAGKTGIGRAFIGMILLGGITSLPELAVSVSAVVRGNPVLSINDVLGSAAINIVLLAAADAFIGRRALTSTVPSPAVMLQGALSIVLLALAAGAVLAGDRPVLGMGIWSWLMLMVYVAAVALLAKDRASSQWKPSRSDEQEQSQADDDDSGKKSLSRLVALTCAAGAVIIVAGFLLADTGAALAERTGLGASFFGAVFLAFSTSLPEVSTILAAVKLRQHEMAISDAIGTNLFNVTILVLVDLLHPGDPVLQEAGRFAAFAALLALVLTAVFLVGMLERRDRTILRMGIDSAVVLATYVAGVVVLFGLR